MIPGIAFPERNLVRPHYTIEVEDMDTHKNKNFSDHALRFAELSPTALQLQPRWRGTHYVGENNTSLCQDFPFTFLPLHFTSASLRPASLPYRLVLFAK